MFGLHSITIIIIHAVFFLDTISGQDLAGYITHPVDSYWSSGCNHTGTKPKNILDDCYTECTNNAECTAFTYIQKHESCTLYKCPVPAPVPNGKFSGYVAYSVKADCFFDTRQYNDSNMILDVCSQLECDGDTGKFKFHGYYDDCKRCMAYWDPHILTYDQGNNAACDWKNPGISRQHCESYAYQKCGTYILSQSVDTQDPGSAVYAKFVECQGADATCVDTVYLKNDPDTTVAVVYKSAEINVQVNGVDVDEDSISNQASELTVLGTNYPVLAWTSTYYNDYRTTICVNLQGSTGFMVRYCGDPYNRANTVVVLFHPGTVNGGLEGLCGNANDNAHDDLVDSNGDYIPIHDRDHKTRWQAPGYNGDGSCPATRINRRNLNNCDTDSSVLNGFISDCETYVGNGFSPEETTLIKLMTDDCVYDLCNATEPEKWKQSIQATVEVQADVQANIRARIIPTKAPTTEASTTKAPTTEAPTTKAPTTDASTTKAPTTEASTTKAPTTEASTTKAQTTEASTTKAPTTDASTTDVADIVLSTEAPEISSEEEEDEKEQTKKKSQGVSLHISVKID